jgi:hypothetical protein
VVERATKRTARSTTSAAVPTGRDGSRWIPKEWTVAAFAPVQKLTAFGAPKEVFFFCVALVCQNQPANAQRPTPQGFVSMHTTWDSKLARQFNCSAQEAQVVVSRNFDTAKLLQVRSEPLRIEQREFSCAQMFDQRYQRDFRCILHAVEH